MRVGLSCMGVVALSTGVQAFVPSFTGLSKVSSQSINLRGDTAHVLTLANAFLVSSVRSTYRTK
jgi:hypothetical protein